MPRNGKLVRITLALAAAGLVAALAVVTAGAASARSSSGTVNGAGSTFVAPLVTKWESAIQSALGITLNYNGIGSTGGVAAITNKQVDFGASDAPLSQFNPTCNSCVQIPWALAATGVIYNLSGLQHLRMTGPVLAQIYMGSIKTWDAPAIKALNPGIDLPSESIVPVYRSDGSGSSYALTDYLSAVSASWKSSIGVSTQPAFKNGVGAKGSSGVAGVVKNTEGAIGYADIAFAITNKIPTMAVKNAAGKFITPGIVSIKAASSAFNKVPANNEMHIVNPPKSARAAYPICTYTYVIVPQVTAKAALLKKFIFYALTLGQKFGIPLRYVPIPKAVLVSSEKTLAKVHS